jgi:hypothetical protein
MFKLRATALAIALATCALPSSAAAQSAFRPLPRLPDLDAMITSSGTSSAVPAPLFDALEAEADVEAPRTFVDARVFLNASDGSNLADGGSMSSQRGGWSATIGRKLGEDTLAALELSTEATFYNFSGNTTLVPGNSNPFNDLYRASLAGTIQTPIDEHTSYFAGIELALGGEDEADARKSLTIGAAGGVRHKASDDFDMSIGVAVLSRLEDDPWIWPWIGFQWKANDWLDFEARGTEIEAHAALDEHWRALARAEYLIRQYRLNSDDPLPNGVFRDNDIRLGLGLERSSQDGFHFQVLGGVSLWRELSTLDKTGAHVTETEVDPALFVGLSLGISL